MSDDSKQKTATTEVPLVTLTIDDQSVSVPKGTTVLEAARSVGIDIPTFCWHPKLKSVGACRMCYVEIEKFPKLMVSCATEAMPDMVVYTASDQVKQGRRAVIEFILANHPLDCPTCDKGGECDLQNQTYAHGIDDSLFDYQKNRFVDEGMTTTFDDLKIGPEIVLNRNRCILCYRCVRANKEAFGEWDLGVFKRGNIAEINSAPGQQVDNPFSGNLVEICPVGALTNSDWRYKIRVWLSQTTPSVCNLTSSGSNLLFYKADHKNHIYRVTSRCNDAIDDGWLSNVTRYGYQIISSPSRLNKPLVKKSGKQVEATWAEAIEVIHQRFTEIKEKKGGVCIGGLASPQLDNESLYSFSKFLRSILGSNGLDFRTDYRMLPSAPDSVFSKLCQASFSIESIDDSDVIVSFGSDLIREHPNEYLRLRKAHNFGQPRIYSLNSYAVKSADVAGLELVYKPGAEEVVLSGLCLAAVEEGLVDAALTAELKNKTTIESVAKAAEMAGVDENDLRVIARAIAQGNKVTFMVGEIVARSREREMIAGALYNLYRLFGLASKGQMAVLARYANSRGAEMLGAVPFLSESTKAKLKEIWGCYPDSAPHHTDAMLSLMKKEEIRGLFLLGGNPMSQYPDAEFVRESLGKLEFMVACDLFETETTEMADVVLPLAGWAEYIGDYVNLEGRVQRAEAAVKPVGQALPGYRIVTDIAKAFGVKLFEDDQQRLQEVNTVLEAYQAMALEGGFFQVAPVVDDPEDGYALPLFVCDDPHHCGYLTEKSSSLASFAGEAYAEISSDLAGKLDVTEGDPVRVESPTGKIIVPVQVSDWLDSDVVLIPRNFASTPVMSLVMRKKRIDRVKLTKVET